LIERQGCARRQLATTMVASLQTSQRRASMKLTSVRVTNYRNIIDSGEVEIGPSTCLVGKNEAGKTAFLKPIFDSLGWRGVLKATDFLGSGMVAAENVVPQYL
jgi:ABC-type branched-subunit amino acid transport system ATPase component